MDTPDSVNLGPFVAAIVKHLGGEVRVPYELFVEVTESDNSLVIDFEDDGATIVITVEEGIIDVD